MEIRYISDSKGLEAVGTALSGARRIALDSEAAGYHRYSDRICLLQLTVDSTTFLIDPLAVDPAEILRPTLEDSGVEILMHGADYDIRLLGRDLGIGVAGLVDTQILAALLGVSALGLAALLEARLGIRLSKKYQKADWAQRPLTAPMLEYAAHDTIHLPSLADLLLSEVSEKGRLEWAEEEFRALEQVRFEDVPADQDPVTRVKGARDLEPREVDRLRAALLWRDGIARDLDRALFRVAGDQVLVDIARLGPKSPGDLEGISGLGQNLVRQHGEELLRRFQAIDALPDDQLQGWPRPQRARTTGGWGRRTPEIEERFNRLKEVRNARANALGIDRGVLISNSLLQTIALSPPHGIEALRNLEGLRKWQVTVVGDELLKAI